jgi:hypothetical protein
MPVTSIPFADGNVLDVQQQVGTGTDTVYFVLDFDANSTTTPAPEVAFQYDYTYDPSAPETIAQMMDAIEAAPGSDFAVTYTPYAGYPAEDFVKNFTYAGTTGQVDGNYYVSTGVYSAADVSPANEQGVTYTPLPLGVSDTDLSPDFDFVGVQGLDPATYDAPPIEAPETAVPEPATGGVALAAGATAVLARRRRPRRAMS